MQPHFGSTGWARVNWLRLCDRPTSASFDVFKVPSGARTLTRAWVPRMNPQERLADRSGASAPARRERGHALRPRSRHEEERPESAHGPAESADAITQPARQRLSPLGPLRSPGLKVVHKPIDAALDGEGHESSQEIAHNTRRLGDGEEGLGRRQGGNWKRGTLGLQPLPRPAIRARKFPVKRDHRAKSPERSGALAAATLPC